MCSGRAGEMCAQWSVQNDVEVAVQEPERAVDYPRDRGRGHDLNQAKIGGDERIWRREVEQSFVDAGRCFAPRRNPRFRDRGDAVPG